MHCMPVILFVSFSAKFGIYTIVGLNETLVEDKIRTLKCPKCVFSINNCPI
jgi:hypothetical protein